jgi:hypothetical protein
MAEARISFSSSVNPYQPHWSVRIFTVLAILWVASNSALLAQPAQPHSDPVAIESEWHKAEEKYGGARQEILDKVESVWPSGQKETLSNFAGRFYLYPCLKRRTPEAFTVREAHDANALMRV